MSIDDLLQGDRPPRFAERAPRTAWPTYLGFGLLVVAVAGTVAFATSPSPYVVERPGPVFDTIGEVRNAEGEDIPLIAIDDEETFPTSGRLDLLTVYVDGSRDRPLPWLDVAAAWFDSSRTVLPVDAVYPPGQTREQSNEQSAIAMGASQQESVAAAFTALDIDYDSVFVVASVVEDTPADGVLEPEDEILAAAGEPISDVEQLRAAVADAGVDGTLDLDIRRDGEERTVSVTPIAGDNGAPVIGVVAASRYDFPFEVKIQLENVGGPSAGMMFALGIYDKLTPGELTGGEHIAGTGTISAEGAVGAIGGIVQKMYGARSAGAGWFLAPASNCDQVVGRIPAGLEVFSVAELDDAIDVVEAIAAGDVSGLPRCRG